jgi:DNA-binding NarL/FixJ family response regulator
MPTAVSSLNVFLADDSRPIRERIGAMLGEHAMKIVGEGATPADCIDGILGAQPDVVVLDCQLEGGTGLEVLKAVRAARPAVAFVVFSNSSAPAYRKRYLAEGAERFLDKTTEFDQLAGAVAQAGHRA